MISKLSKLWFCWCYYTSTTLARVSTARISDTLFSKFRHTGTGTQSWTLCRRPWRSKSGMCRLWASDPDVPNLGGCVDCGLYYPWTWWMLDSAEVGICRKVGRPINETRCRSIRHRRLFLTPDMFFTRFVWYSVFGATYKSWHFLFFFQWYIRLDPNREIWAL